MPDLSKMTLTELIEFAEEQARVERETPSLIDAESPERYASWGATLEMLRIAKERGMPEQFTGSLRETIPKPAALPMQSHGAEET